MAYRVLNVSDVSTRPWATVGDILIDSPTFTHTDGRLKFDITNAATVFSTARMGANIWIDGDAGDWYFFRLRSDAASDLSVWSISTDINNPVHIRPVPGTQVRVLRSLSSNSGFLMLFANLKYVKLSGENDAYPGLRDGWPGTFLTGKFGFYISNNIFPIGGHTLAISCPNNGHFRVEGTEHQGGFSAIRFSGTSAAINVKLSLKRLYMGRAGDGEGAYVGSTQAYPYVLLECEMDDIVVAGRACEGLQVQHIVSGVGVNNTIRNYVNFAAAMDGAKAFQGGQDTIDQWSQASGGNILRDGINTGAKYSSVGLNHFGTTDYPDLVVDTTRPSIAKNLYFECSGIFSYIHNSNRSGVWKVMKKIDLGNFSNNYYSDSVNNPQDYYVSAHNGTDRLSWVAIKHDGAKSEFFQDTEGHEIINITEAVIPYPQFVNSGFYPSEPSSTHLNWKETYGNYHDNPTVDRAVTYPEGTIVWNVEHGVEHAPYRVMSTHTTTGVGALTPRQDILANGEVRYKAIYWDESGERNIDSDGVANPSWNAGDTQSIIPPDDFRLQADSYHNLLGRGLRANLQNTVYTQHQWYRSLTADAEDAIAIPGAKTKYYDAQDVDQGYYLASTVRRKDSAGNWDTPRWSNWTLVD
jgi:hypothetical protein